MIIMTKQEVLTNLKIKTLGLAIPRDLKISNVAPMLVKRRNNVEDYSIGRWSEFHKRYVVDSDPSTNPIISIECVYSGTESVYSGRDEAVETPVAEPIKEVVADAPKEVKTPTKKTAAPTKKPAKKK